MKQDPKMNVICANCGMRYGRHQLIGDSCPKRGKIREYKESRFKPKSKRPSAAGERDK